MKKVKWLFFIVSLLIFAACGDSDNEKSNDDGNGKVDTNTVDIEQVDEESSDEKVDDVKSDDNETVDEEPAKLEATHTVVFETTVGNFSIELYGDEMPITTANFAKYVEEKFFDGLIFHRIIKDFVIQGGGFDKNLEHKDGHDPIDLEHHPLIKHDKYVLSMARSQTVNSATSQFFITTAVVPHLDPDPEEPEFTGYAAFGRVVEGFDIIDAINVVETEDKGGAFTDIPKELIIMEKVYLK